MHLLIEIRHYFHRQFHRNYIEVKKKQLYAWSGHFQKIITMMFGCPGGRFLKVWVCKRRPDALLAKTLNCLCLPLFPVLDTSKLGIWNKHVSSKQSWKCLWSPVIILHSPKTNAVTKWQLWNVTGFCLTMKSYIAFEISWAHRLCICQFSNHINFLHLMKTDRIFVNMYQFVSYTLYILIF